MSKPSEITVTAWARLVRAQRTAMEGVEAALKADGFPPLAWYDVLLELRRAPDGLRLHELEVRTLLAQYNISRLADRIVAAGHAAKQVDPEDARGRVLTITQAGRDLQAAMWPVYAAAIQRQVGEKLSAAEADQLAALLAKLAA